MRTCATCNRIVVLFCEDKVDERRLCTRRLLILRLRPATYGVPGLLDYMYLLLCDNCDVDFQLLNHVLLEAGQLLLLRNLRTGRI